MKRQELILLIVLIVILVFTAVFLYFNQKNSVITTAPVSIATTTVTTATTANTNQAEISRLEAASSTPVTDQNNIYTDTDKTFSFSYPKQFVLSDGIIAYSQDWNVQTTNLGLLLAVVKVPRSFLPQTNFSEAKFTVGTSADSVAIKDCFKSDGGSIGTTSEVTINNQKFTRITLADAGAGNFYETTSYRTIYNNQCYAIEYTIHSTNIGNYSPDQGIKEFDKNKIEPLLENIVSSFKFL